MPNTLSLEIVTHSGVAYQAQVDGLVAPGVDGYFGVLPRHAPLVAQLKVGQLRLRQGQSWRVYAISGGIFHVRSGQALVLADALEAAEEIDVARAQQALDRARRRLREGRRDPQVDADRARAALMRALNRLRAADLHHH